VFGSLFTCVVSHFCPKKIFKRLWYLNKPKIKKKKQLNYIFKDSHYLNLSWRLRFLCGPFSTRKGLSWNFIYFITQQWQKNEMKLGKRFENKGFWINETINKKNSKCDHNSVKKAHKEKKLRQNMMLSEFSVLLVINIWYNLNFFIYKK